MPGGVGVRIGMCVDGRGCVNKVWVWISECV